VSITPIRREVSPHVATDMRIQSLIGRVQGLIARCDALGKEQDHGEDLIPSAGGAL
jgi:hypothetical protein